MAKDRKTNSKVSQRDLCMTPGYAMEPLAEVFPVGRFNSIWEPGVGTGRMAYEILSRFGGWAGKVVGTDIYYGPQEDFFNIKTSLGECIVTNPPFSIRREFTIHALDLCENVAFLMPTETVSLKWFHELCKKHGEPGIVWFSPRINFEMPNKKWEGSGSQFPCAWFTWGFFTGNKFFQMNHWTSEYRKSFETDGSELDENRHLWRDLPEINKLLTI